MINLLFGKKPNKNTIRRAAEHLMAIYGVTTTLEVKRYLRAQGYVVFQYDISRKMDRLCAESGWRYDCNGIFRLYFIPLSQPTQSAQQNLPIFSAN